jgi:hypothetical protein
VPPSGYLIANQTHTTKRFELAKSAEIVVLKGAATEKMTPDAFLKAMGSATPDPVLKKALWWVFEDGEIIVRMEQTPL